MIPVRLSLKGFLSYQQPVELDFTSFDLACISGANGAGKSALLDAITWALFGRARKKEDDALINNSSQSAEVIFEFLYENDHYRIRRSKTQGKTAELEFYLLNPQNQWIVLSEHSLRETENRIVQIFRMDYDTFINTCFFLQGKADQFAQQPAGKRKEILSSILNLEKWEEYRMATALRRRGEENEIAAINAWLEEIEAELAQEKERVACLERTSRELEQKSGLRKEKEKSVEDIRRQADMLQEQEKFLRTCREQVDDLNRQKQENQLRLEARKNELNSYLQILKNENAIQENYSKLTELRGKMERLNQQSDQFHVLDKKRLEQENIIELERARLEQEQQNLLKRQKESLALADKRGLLKGKLSAIESELEKLDTVFQEKEKDLTAIQDLQQTQANSIAENRQLQSSIRELQARIGQLKSARASCPLCGQELTEQHRSNLLASLGLEEKNQGDRYRRNTSIIQDCNEKISELRGKISQIERSEKAKEQVIKSKADCEAEIRTISAEIEKWEKLEAPKLKEVQNQLQNRRYELEAQNRLDEILAALHSLGYDSRFHEEIRQKELAARESEEQWRTLEKARSSAQPLQREVDLIGQLLAELEEKIQQQVRVIRQVEENNHQTAATLPNLAQMEKELNVLRSEENELRLETGRAEQEVAVLANRKLKKEELLARRKEKALFISHLESLERTFGKNGVPAMLIEQALPDIESKANQILDQLSADSMSLRFTTQRERKNKKEEGAIQTLDILITDSSGSREYELFSGGEAFRINFAIRLALSQALAKRAGARLQTLVIDEGFGSQDADGRLRLIEAINTVMQNSGQAEGDEELSDIRKILVITHLDELKEAFPVRIEVEKKPTGSILQVVS